MIRGATGLQLTGERFGVTYRIVGSEEVARARAEVLCIEQTVEFPADLIASPTIREGIFGRIEDLRPAAAAPESGARPAHDVVVSFALETAGGELTQLLNVIFGNTSLKPGVRVQRLDLGPLLGDFQGPRFGCAGLRDLLGVPTRPLLCAAAKPMGLSAAELADLAGRFALGGIDLIKDDHGIADQPFSRFAERVRRCADAVAEANARTGGRSVYVANVTADGAAVDERAALARAAGAGGLMLAPGLTGWAALRRLAAEPSLGLPLLYHPALQGSFVVAPDSGVAHEVIFGTLPRLLGADAAIFPNTGGRFGFSEAECSRIAHACAAPLGRLRPSLPCPGGGMSLQGVPAMLELYGLDVVLLIGGGLFRPGEDLVSNCLRLRELAEAGDCAPSGEETQWT